MPKYLLVFKMQSGGEDECQEFEGTLDDAIKEATGDCRHTNYGRDGVTIYEIGEPIFQKLRDDS